MGNLLSIVINNNFIRIVELSTGNRGTVVSRLLTKEVPKNLVEGGTVRNVREFSEYLTATLRYANIKTKKVVFSLPSDRVMTKEVLLPELNEDKLKTTIKANAAEYFPIELSDYVLSYFVISKVVKEYEPEEEDENKKKKRSKKHKKVESQLRLMIVAAPNDMVQSYYDVAKLSRLNLEFVDYTGNSAFQLTSNQIGEESSLVIQLNRENTVLTIYNNNIMILQRNVDFGSTAVVQTVADLKRLDYDEAERQLETRELIHNNFDDGDVVTDSLYYLIGNIKRVIEYYTGRNPDHPLEQVYVMGDGSTLLGLDLLLEGQLNLPVETVGALKHVLIKKGSDISGREILKYMDNIGAVIEPVNFVPKKLEQDLRRRLEAKVYRVMILLALFAALLVVTIPALNYFNTAVETLDIQNKLATVEDARPILNDYRLAQQRYEDVKNVQTLIQTNNQSLKSFIDIFEQLRPSNISIDSFSCSEGEVSFNALASGKKTVAKLIQQLNMVANVSEVKVSNLSSSFEGDQETVSFSVTCKLSREAAVLSGESNEIYGMTRQEAYESLNENVSQIPFEGYEDATIDASAAAQVDDAMESLMNEQNIGGE